MNDQHEYRKTVLANGFEVHTLNIPNANQKLYAEINVKAGALHETGKKGVAHYLEHMLAFGSDKYAERDILPYFRKMGGSYNFMTMQSATNYFAYAKNEKVSKYITRVGSLLTAPAFTKEHVELERGPIIAETRSLYDDLKNNDEFAAIEVLYKGQDIAVPVIGTLQSVQAITYDDIRNFYDAAYVASNMFLVVAGRINHDDAVTQAAEIFSAMPAKESSLTRKIPNYSEGTYRVPRDKNALGIGIGFDSYGLGHPDYMTFRGLRDILSYKINDRLREQDKLVYSSDVTNEMTAIAPLMMIKTAFDPNKAPAVLEAIFDVMKTLPNTLTQENIDISLNNEEENLAEFYNNPAMNGDFLARSIRETGEYIPYDSEINIWQTLKPDDMIGVAQDIFSQKAFLVGIGPTDSMPDVDIYLDDLRRHWGIKGPESSLTSTFSREMLPSYKL